MTNEIVQYISEEDESVQWSKSPEFQAWALGELPHPITVDIGGTHHHLDSFDGPGSLIIAHPDASYFSLYPRNRACIYGRHDAVDLPAGTADTVELNMIVTWVATPDNSPIRVVREAIRTSQRIAVPGASLQIIDLHATLTTVARYVQQEGRTVQFRKLDLSNPDDNQYCNRRSYDALHMADADIGLLVVSL